MLTFPCSTNDLLSFPPRISSEVYRRVVKVGDLVTCRIQINQTDMLVSGFGDLRERAKMLVRQYRHQVEDYIEKHPYFAKAMCPVNWDAFAPPIVKSMIEAASRTGVGPMASVAGAIAEYVGFGLLRESRDVIVENGGDVFVCSSKQRELLLLAESSDFLGLRVALPPSPKPIGVCTSSGKSGHSVSFGSADAVMVVGISASFADAAATSIANLIKGSSDIKRGIKKAREIGAYGVVILVEEQMGAWGQIEFLG